ncbi:hypothetical protein [Streptosporangium sp. NBC_01469]|uniref:hypothetical protein n=2 Tax=unclassified Streptosporangium TaxID=2632669 RepID=UPI002E27ACC6|nr:hypothetical protein [Streptosporangium sp. NBC_01469]
MIDSLFDRAASVLERRFLRNAFLPVLLFLPVTLAPCLLQGGNLERGLAAWEGQTLTFKFLAVIGYFTFCWFSAAIVASQWRNIIRLFEGYPVARFPWLESIGVRWHSARSAELVDLVERERDRMSASELRYWAYPETGVLPTRLGNVLRAAEFYPIRRYGISLITVWPRLHKVLPRETAEDVEDARATMEFLLVLCLWLVAFAALNPVLAVLLGTSMPLSILLFALGLVLAYWAYLSAIPAAAEYGEHLRAAFEVHRLKLLEQLRLPQPDTLLAERARWEDLDRFILEGASPGWRYEPDAGNELRIRIVTSEHGRTDDEQ